MLNPEENIEKMLKMLNDLKKLQTLKEKVLKNKEMLKDLKNKDNTFDKMIGMFDDLKELQLISDEVNTNTDLLKTLTKEIEEHKSHKEIIHFEKFEIDHLKTDHRMSLN